MTYVKRDQIRDENTRLLIQNKALKSQLTKYQDMRPSWMHSTRVYVCICVAFALGFCLGSIIKL